MASVLLFDVMDTLVREPFFEDVPTHFGMSLEELLAAKDPVAWIEFEHGHITEAEFFERFFADRRPIDGQALVATIRSGYRWLDGAEQLLAELDQAGHAIHALSNYPLWYRHIEAELELSRYLEWTFVSCETGVRKPASAAFAGAVERLGVAPGECLFVDDQPRNIAAAEAQGLSAILATDPATVRRALVERGLLAPV